MAGELTKKKCVPCEGGVPPLRDEEEHRYMEDTPHWQLSREGTHKLIRKFTFKDFAEAMVFVNKVANLAEEEGHHPNFEISWNKVTLTLTTHAIGGLSDNDFIMAAKIDGL